MRVTISKLFETFQLPEPVRGVAPFVDFVNLALDQVVKALQQGLTLRDNVRCELKELTFAAGTAPTQEFTPAQRAVEGVIPLQTLTSNTLQSFHWEFTSSGAIRITAYPRDTAATLKVKFLVLFA